MAGFGQEIIEESVQKAVPERADSHLFKLALHTLIQYA